MDNCYYEKNYKISDLVNYVQPTQYIVESTDYDDTYPTPVLTPGKSFILGYTNETDGIFVVKDKVIIFDDFTTASRLVDFDFKVKSSAMKILVVKNENIIDTNYFYYLLQHINYVPYTHKRHWISIFEPMIVTIPPLWYQRIVAGYLDVLFSKLINIDVQRINLGKIIEQIKFEILNYYFGENSCYKSYYEKDYKLGEILRYIQPGPYIVNSTEYSDDYTTPVLTPGKSFILGYTNETDGIFVVKNKVIIFDDFTTASRLVDFDFKVKSSAMKILEVENDELFDGEYMFYRLQIINVINDTHKRYWISEYAPISLRIHTLDEQKKIVQVINDAYTILNIMSNSI